MSILSFCSCSVCCGVQLFHIEIMQLNEIFGGNEFDNRFFDGCLRANLNKFRFKKVLQHTVPKRDLYISLTFLKKLSLLAWLDLEKDIRDILPCLNLKLVFKIKDRLSFKFTIRDKISKEMRSLICYKFPCSSCNATYYGKTKRCFKVRVSEHTWVSAPTGKNIKPAKNSVVCDHKLVCYNVVSFGDFSVFANGTNDFWNGITGESLNRSWWATVKENIWVGPFDVFSLRTCHICSLASLFCSSESLDE